jgi:hypothetical protein
MQPNLLLIYRSPTRALRVVTHRSCLSTTWPIRRKRFGDYI